MHCGERMPRSCECFRQCRQFYCAGGKGACEMPRDLWFVRCFERLKPALTANDSTASQQAVYSDVPEEWEEKQGRVAWYLGMRNDLGRDRLSRQKATAVRALWTDSQAFQHRQVRVSCLYGAAISQQLQLQLLLLAQAVHTRLLHS